jgi:hypothetical protein
MRDIRENTDCREPHTQCNGSDEHDRIASLHSKTLKMLCLFVTNNCKLAACFL